MAKYIYSKIQSDKLLHIVHRQAETKEGRQDFIPTNNFLQMASIILKPNQTFKPHKHKWNDFNGSKIAQESWIVLEGAVKAILYDIDDSILEEVFLHAGDLSITLEGGHNYLASSEGAKVLEVKTGPYYGIEMDKEFIKESNCSWCEKEPRSKHLNGDCP